MNRETLKEFLSGLIEYEPIWIGYSHVTALALNNFGRQDSASMVAEAARGQKLPESFVNTIIERTDGVPLFIEEITATLSESAHDAGVARLDTSSDKWRSIF